jgi:hypothetical protein
MYFTGMTFLTTVNRNIRFLTATFLINWKKKVVMDATQQVIKVHQSKGHNVQEMEFIDTPIHTVIADNEFQALRDDIEELGINVHVVSKNEHAPEIEHQNRVIKERARAIVQTLPYDKLPRKMRLAMIHYIIFWLNQLPREDQILSPKELIMGETILDVKALCKIPFGSYVQVHDGVEITNTLTARTTGAINLGPNNMTGGHKFFNLTTGEIIIRRKWTELPVPNEVIMCLSDLAKDDEHSDLSQLFHDNQDQDNETEYETHLVDDDLLGNIEEGNIEETDEETKIFEHVDVVEHVEELQNDLAEKSPITKELLTTEESPTTEELLTTTDEPTMERAHTEETQHTHKYHLRPNRRLNYSHKYSFLSVHAGVRKWGEKAREAIKDELGMLHKERVFKGVPNPTQEQEQKALVIHCFVVEKRDGRIKA